MVIVISFDVSFLNPCLYFSILFPATWPSSPTTGSRFLPASGFNIWLCFAFQKNETELIIIVTPHLVKPLDSAKQTLPTDFYIEPDDTEIYLLGLMEGWEKNQPSTARGELDGEFGHGMPYPD